MKLFICDDNISFSETLRTDILALIPEAVVGTFPTISSLMFALEDSGSSVDGIILDIKNSDGNGIDAAARIKESYPLINLIFVTGYGDKYSQDIFDCPPGAEPIAFLIKPVKEKYLKLALDKIQNTRKFDESYIQITYNRTTEFINDKKIMFISSDKRKLTIHTTEKEYTYYDNFDSVASKLRSHFCRCHKSYIVNLDFITSVENWHSFIMSDKTIIPIGKTYLENLRRRLIAHKASIQKEEKYGATDN